MRLLLTGGAGYIGSVCSELLLDEGHEVVDAAGADAFDVGLHHHRVQRDIDPRARRFPMPDSSVKDPHTMMFAPDGDLWFTVQFGNYVGRLVPSTGKVAELFHRDWVSDARSLAAVRDAIGRQIESVLAGI